MIPIYLTQSQTVVGRQLQEAISEDVRFRYLGSTLQLGLIERDLQSLVSGAPSVALVVGGCLDAPPRAAVQELLRCGVSRVVVLLMHGDQDQERDVERKLMNLGAMHVEWAQLNDHGHLDSHHVRRLLRLIASLSYVRVISTHSKTGTPALRLQPTAQQSPVPPPRPLGRAQRPPLPATPPPPSRPSNPLASSLAPPPVLARKTQPPTPPPSTPQPTSSSSPSGTSANPSVPRVARPATLSALPLHASSFLNAPPPPTSPASSPTPPSPRPSVQRPRTSALPPPSPSAPSRPSNDNAASASLFDLSSRSKGDSGLFDLSSRAKGDSGLFDPPRSKADSSPDHFSSPRSRGDSGFFSTPAPKATAASSTSLDAPPGSDPSNDSGIFNPLSPRQKSDRLEAPPADSSRFSRDSGSGLRELPPDSSSAWTTTSPRSTRQEPSFTSDPLAALGRRRVHPLFDLVGIGSSTGGLTALENILSRLPHDFPVPLCIVQHIGRGFDQDFVNTLQRATPMSVRLIHRPVEPVNGTIYVCPSGIHVIVKPGPVLELSEHPASHLHRPSVSVLFNAMATALGDRCVGVLLTGMGQDGADGLLKIRQMGGRSLVQNRETCLVFGMPRAAIQLGAAEQVLPVSDIGPELVKLVKTPTGLNRR